jgi:hypothetical protein
LETGRQAIVRNGTEGLEQALDFVYGSALGQQRCLPTHVAQCQWQMGRLGSLSEKALDGAGCRGLTSHTCIRGASPTRSMCCFSSPKGAEVAVYIQVTHMNVHAESG